MKVALDAGAFLPTRAHPTDAGYDLKSPVCAVVPAGGSCAIDTGVHVELPHGKCGLLVSKSGLNVKYDIVSTGLIDEGYTGSIVVKLQNLGSEDFAVERGDKISQLVVIGYHAESLDLVGVEDLQDTPRGSAGFGSTGK